MKRNQDMLEKGTFPKLLLNLCLPTIVIMLVMVVYNMADTFFIGQTGEPAKIAAISLCAPVFSILSGLGTLFGSGGCTSVSLALGRKEYDKLKATTSFCCFGALLVGFLFLVIVISIVRPLSLALGADAETLEYTCSYLRIIALGGPFIMFNNVFTNLIRADGAAVKSMICNLIGTVSNIILDALFIMGFSWGVSGAAFATVLGNVLSCIYLLFYLTKKQQAFSLHPKHLTWKKDVLLPVLALGLPLSFNTLLMSISHMIANRMMISYGSMALAAQGVAGKVGMLISMLAMGICMGMQPALSYNFGSQNIKRMYQIIRNTGIFTFVAGLTLSLFCFLFRTNIIAAFINNSDVIRHGQMMVLASILPGPFYGLYQLCQTFLQSTGKAFYATFVALLDKGLFYLPLLMIMNHFFGMYGIAYTAAVTLVFSLLTGAFLCLRWHRQIVRNKAGAE